MVNKGKPEIIDRNIFLLQHNTNLRHRTFLYLAICVDLVHIYRFSPFLFFCLDYSLIFFLHMYDLLINCIYGADLYLNMLFVFNYIYLIYYICLFLAYVCATCLLYQSSMYLLIRCYSKIK